MSTRPVGALPTMLAEVGVEAKDVAVFGQHDVHRRIGSARHALGHALVQRQVAVLAVHRHEEPGPREREHQLQLFLAAVARHVHVPGRSW